MALAYSGPITRSRSHSLRREASHPKLLSEMVQATKDSKLAVRTPYQHYVRALASADPDFIPRTPEGNTNFKELGHHWKHYLCTDHATTYFYSSYLRNLLFCADILLLQAENRTRLLRLTSPPNDHLAISYEGHDFYSFIHKDGSYGFIRPRQAKYGRNHFKLVTPPSDARLVSLEEYTGYYPRSDLQESRFVTTPQPHFMDMSRVFVVAEGHQKGALVIKSRLPRGIMDYAMLLPVKKGSHIFYVKGAFELEKLPYLLTV